MFSENLKKCCNGEWDYFVVVLKYSLSSTLSLSVHCPVPAPVFVSFQIARDGTFLSKKSS